MQQRFNNVIRFIEGQKWLLIFIPVFFILLFFITLPRVHKGKIKNEQFTYTGTILKGAPEGSGTMVFKNGDTYTGHFKSGKFNGQGTFMSKKNNWTYKGFFTDGLPDGQGEMTSLDGKQKFTMENGVIVK